MDTKSLLLQDDRCQAGFMGVIRIALRQVANQWIDTEMGFL